MARFKFVSKLMGTILLVVNFFSLIVWYYNVMIEGALIWLFTFLLTVGLVLMCERITTISEIDSFLHVHSSDKSLKQIKKLFFIVPVVLIVVALIILLVATFYELRAYFWLLFLFDTSGILLVYSGLFLDMLKKAFLKDEEYEKDKKESYDDMQNKDENNVVSCENIA